MKQRDRPRGLSSELAYQVEDFCSQTSTHGGVWYSRIAPAWVKVPFAFVIGILQCLVFTLFVWNTFNGAPATITSTKYMPLKDVHYPQMAFCNSRAFHKERSLEMGVDADLAAFMSLIADPTVAVIVGDKAEAWTEFIVAQYVRFEEQLGSMTVDKIHEIYDYVTLNCEEFIVECKVSYEIYDSESCCKESFGKNKTFMPHGICFRDRDFMGHTTEPLWGRFDRIRVALNVSQALTLKPNFEAIGLDKRIRGGASFALYVDDDAASALITRGLDLQAGRGVTASIGRELIDRRGFRTSFPDMSHELDQVGESCIDESDDIYRLLMDVGFEKWTKANCNLLFLSTLLSSACDTVKTFGIDGIRGEELARRNPKFPELTALNGVKCLPNDIVEAIQRLANATFTDKIQQDSRKFCFPECIETRITTQLSTTSLDSDEEIDSKGLILFEMQYASSSMIITEIRPKELFDYFAETGGLIGIMLGASIISLIEFVFYLAKFIFCLLSHIVRSSFMK